MSIASEIYRLNRLLNQLAQSSSFSSAQFEVLTLIKKHNPVTLGQLCALQGVRMPTMSKLVDELQNAALVIRAQSKDDARQRWIVPTQKGISVLAELTDESAKQWSNRLKGLTNPQQRQIEQSLSLLSNQIVTQRGAD